jgi:hypothetical protein
VPEAWLAVSLVWSIDAETLWARALHKVNALHELQRRKEGWPDEERETRKTYAIGLTW